MKITVIEKDLNKANQIRQSAKKPADVDMTKNCLVATAIRRTKNPEKLCVGVSRVWIDEVKYYIPEQVTSLIELWLGDHIDKDKMKEQNQAVLAQLPFTFELTNDETLTMDGTLV